MSRYLLTTLLLMIACAAVAEGIFPLLSAEDAFKVEAHRIDAGKVEIRFDIAPGYAIYRKRTALTLEGSGTDQARIIWPTAIAHAEKYRGMVSVTIYLKESTSPAVVVATAQGCADVGVCYQPFKRRLTIIEHKPL